VHKRSRKPSAVFEKFRLRNSLVSARRYSLADVGGEYRANSPFGISLVRLGAIGRRVPSILNIVAQNAVGFRQASQVQKGETFPVGIHPPLLKAEKAEKLRRRK
jgi:hypothetical protein